MRVAFENKYKSYSGDYLASDDFFTVEQINKAVVGLKVVKAAGYDGTMAEHLLYSHPSALLITYSCNLILLTGHVPAEFGLGVTHPILKCKSGNKTVGYDDFRGITISPVISKVLENAYLIALVTTFGPLITSVVSKVKLGAPMQFIVFAPLPIIL